MLKMNELAKLTNTPKSTILYYVKEGLLPEPLKDKPNFHLYAENNVQLIEFIKYLQTNFNATLSQIKAVFSHKEFDLNNPYKSLTHSIHLIMGAENEHFTASELCREFDISEEELAQLVKSGLIYPRDGIFTNSEREMLRIIVNCDETQRQLLQSYATIAKILAQQEVDLGTKIIQNTEQQNERLKHFFDMLLRLKPYIFNLQTFHTYQENNKSEK